MNNNDHIYGILIVSLILVSAAAVMSRRQLSPRTASPTWQGEVQPVDEGAFGWFHLRAGVVQSLTAPHDRTQRFLQWAVQLRLVQPEEENEQCGKHIIMLHKQDIFSQLFLCKKLPERIKRLKSKKCMLPLLCIFVPSIIYIILNLNDIWNDYILVNYWWQWSPAVFWRRWYQHNKDRRQNAAVGVKQTGTEVSATQDVWTRCSK